MINIIYFLSLFLIIFLTKIKFVEVSFILIFILILFNFKEDIFKIKKHEQVVFSILLFFTLYCGLITLIYGVQEIIFFLKLLKTTILFVLLIFFTNILIKKDINYDKFKVLFIIVTSLHSIIIILCIISPEIRNSIYSLTGYSPRGPGWSRSPGLTISFNTTSLVHVFALYLLFVTNVHLPKVYKILASSLIFISLFFLGRTIAFSGLLLIFILLLRKKIILLSLIIPIILAGIFYMESIDVSTIKNDNYKHIYYNYKHATKVFSEDSDISISNYNEKVLSKHYYFSDDFLTILFGNSLAGHIGLLNRTGETESDLGFINSINANGVIITIFFYIFYISLIYYLYVRNINYLDMLFLVFLTFVLTFKETGFFAAHATVLIFFVFLLQLKEKDKGNL